MFPESLLYIARKARRPIGISPEGIKSYGLFWDLQVHVPGAAISCAIPCVGDFASVPPSLTQVWEALGLALKEKAIVGTPIPSVLS